MGREVAELSDDWSWLRDLYFEARRRWIDIEIDKIKVRRSKIEVYMVIRSTKVKIIIYKDGRVWVVSKLKGLNISLKKIVTRILEKRKRRQE